MTRGVFLARLCVDLRGQFLSLPGGVPRHDTFNLATLRRITLNLLRADKSSAKSLSRKRLRCALVPDYLISLLKF